MINRTDLLYAGSESQLKNKCRMFKETRMCVKSLENLERGDICKHPAVSLAVVMLFSRHRGKIALIELEKALE